MTFLRVVIVLFSKSMTYSSDTWQNLSVFNKILRLKHEGHNLP